MWVEQKQLIDKHAQVFEARWLVNEIAMWDLDKPKCMLSMHQRERNTCSLVT